MPATINTLPTAPTLTAERVMKIERMLLGLSRLAFLGDRHQHAGRAKTARRYWMAVGRVEHRALQLLIEVMPQAEVRRLVDLKLAEVRKQFAR